MLALALAHQNIVAKQQAINGWRFSSGLASALRHTFIVVKSSVFARLLKDGEATASFHSTRLSNDPQFRHAARVAYDGAKRSPQEANIIEVSEGNLASAPAGGQFGGQIPPDLQKIIDAWPRLHHHRRAAIVRMVQG
jgi:hypothetical protein